MASNVQPDIAMDHYISAWNFYRSEKYEDAAGEALLAIKTSPQPFVSAERLLAYCYSRGVANPDDTLKQFQKVTKLAPEDAGSWLTIAIVARDEREVYLAAAEKAKNLSLHRDADRYHKLSQTAFGEALKKFPAFAKDPNQLDAFITTMELPIVAGDFIAESKTMPVQDAFAWYRIAAGYDVEAVVDAADKTSLYSEDEIAELRNDLEEIKAKAYRKEALLESSSTVNQKRNKFAERTLGQRMLINVAIIFVVLLFACWGLYALFT